jgi:hypothetical protein
MIGNMMHGEYNVKKQKTCCETRASTSIPLGVTRDVRPVSHAVDDYATSLL